MAIMYRISAWVLLVILKLRIGNTNGERSNLSSHSNWNLVNNELCGLSYSDRIIGGTNASMGSYPWLARIGYLKNSSSSEDEITYRCGGSAISEYYIITAAHCVTNLPHTMRVARVRLGEHNTETNPDCERSFCNDPLQDFEIDEIVHHKNYDKPKLRNDIALIRLKKKIQFTEFVRPICLMKGKLLTKSYEGQVGEVAGWGVYDINEPQMSTLLQTVKLPIVAKSRCTIGYRRVSPVGSSQLCVGGTIGKDSCGGDSGGPLMKVESERGSGPRYYIIGLVSFGAKLCGETNLPGVYTKIADFVPWILDNIKP